MNIELPKLKKVVEDKRKKILLLSDDIRFHSGIATMSRQLVLGTAEKYKWVQLAAALQHPDHGKVIDISESVNKEFNIDSASIKLFCHTGYGSIPIMREILDMERPDVVMLFTDPRHWMWFWPFEHELKTKYKIPIAYLSIWDNLAYPYWNNSYYASCDLLMAISKQTHQIHKGVLNYNNTPWLELNNHIDAQQSYFIDLRSARV